VQKTKDNTYIQAAIIYILENFHSSLTLEKTAKYISLAPAYFSSLFQKEVGIGFKEYLDNIRFDHALKLLTFTNMPVCEICSASGFADYTNFARRFKSKYHCAPTGYRKMNRERIK
jgi:two-component system response regulator YesN